jgi:hypothetical protein
MTMLGLGYPIAEALKETAYAEVLPAIQDPVRWSDAMLDHYQNRGMPLVRTAVAHLRSHGVYRSDVTAEEMAGDFFDGLSAFSSGTASREQIKVFLASVLPRYGRAPEELAEFIIDLYARLQGEISLPKLLETAQVASVQDLLSVQPLAAEEMEDSLKRFGSMDFTCDSCQEWRGLLVGAMLPYHLRIGQLDLLNLWPDSMVPLALHESSLLAQLQEMQDP